MQPFKQTSTWMPPRGRNEALEVYIRTMRQEIETIIDGIANSNNLPLRERQALKHLQKRDDIVIKPADKGAGVVVMRLSS